MKKEKTGSQHDLFVDIGHSSLKVLWKNRGLEMPIERSAGGKLTDSSREAVLDGLRALLRKSRRRAPKTYCALPARGVSLRHFTLPRASREETKRLLALQIEAEFPLPPDELAWGFSSYSPRLGGPEQREADMREVTVVALRRGILEDYFALFSACDLQPVFSLGGLVTHFICPDTDGGHAILDIGETHSDLVLFEGEKPLTARSFAWGGNAVTQSIGKALRIDATEAEKLKCHWAGSLSLESTAEEAEHTDRSPDQALRAAIDASLSPLAGALKEALQSGYEGNGNQPPRRLFVTGKTARLPGLVPRLAQRIGGFVACHLLEVPDVRGASAVTLGLQRQAASPARSSALTLLPPERKRKVKKGRKEPVTWFWLLAAVVLGLASLCLRYVEPLRRIPDLEKTLASKESELKSAANASVDDELGFLRHVERAQSQVAYLDILAAMAKAAPAMSHFATITMNREGEISVKGTMPNSHLANAFRQKLLVCGLFTHAVLHEITPAKKKVQFRLQAMVRKGAKIEEFRELEAKEEKDASKKPAPPSKKPQTPLEPKAPEKPTTPENQAKKKGP